MKIKIVMGHGGDKKSGPVKTGPTRVVDTPLEYQLLHCYDYTKYSSCFMQLCKPLQSALPQTFQQS